MMHKNNSLADTFSTHDVSESCQKHIAVSFDIKVFLHDLIAALRNHDTWLYLAWIDIVLRYRRTVLGPFWMVIVSFVSIVCIAVLGSLLFKVKIGDFFPYVACGMISWAYISMLITESCTVFLSQLGLIKNVRVNVLSFCFRMFTRSTIIFAHSLVVIFLILLYSKIVFWKFFILLPIIAFVFMINAISSAISIGFLSTRYRDVIHIVQTLIGILAFMTPIMWKPEMLGSYSYLAELNPMTHFISIIREPLLGHYPTILSVIVVAACTTCNLLLAGFVYSKFSQRIAFWL